MHVDTDAALLRLRLRSAAQSPNSRGRSVWCSHAQKWLAGMPQPTAERHARLKDLWLFELDKPAAFFAKEI